MTSAVSDLSAVMAWWSERVTDHPPIPPGPAQQVMPLEHGRDLAPGRVVTLTWLYGHDAVTVRGSVTVAGTDCFRFEPSQPTEYPGPDTGVLLRYMGGRNSVALPTVIRKVDGLAARCELPPLVVRTDRRRYRRYRAVTEVAVTDGIGRRIKGRSINLSGDGMSLAVPTDWQGTESLGVRFHFGGREWSASARLVDLQRATGGQHARLHFVRFATGDDESLDTTLAANS